jgi:hypothetical protein
MKIGPVGAELYHEEGHTGIHNEANCHFSEFYEQTQNG